MSDTDVLQGVPEGVRRAQATLAAPSRLMVLRTVMEQPSTFAEILARLGLSGTGARLAVVDLVACGYLIDNSPEGRQRRSSAGVFSADRERVLRDFTDLMIYLAR